MTHTLRTRSALTVTDPALLLARAGEVADHTGSPAPRDVDTALATLLLADGEEDLLAAPEEYGLAVTPSATILTRDTTDTDTEHTWLDQPFGDLDTTTALVHLIDTDETDEAA